MSKRQQHCAFKGQGPVLLTPEGAILFGDAGRWMLWDFRREVDAKAIDVGLPVGAAVFVTVDGRSWLLLASGEKQRWPIEEGASFPRSPIRFMSGTSGARSARITIAGDIIVAIAAESELVGWSTAAITQGDVRPVWTRSVPSPELATIRCLTGTGHVVVAAAGPSMRVVDPQTGGVREIPVSVQGRPLGIAAHPTRPIVAVFGRTVQLLDVVTGAEIDALCFAEPSTVAGAFTPDGKCLLVVGHRALYVYDLETRSCGELALAAVEASRPPEDLLVAAEGDAAIAVRDGEITVYSLAELGQRQVDELPAAGTAAALLVGSERGESYVHALYGAPSTVFEALQRSIPTRFNFAADAPEIRAEWACPACGTELKFVVAPKKGIKESPLAAVGWRLAAAMNLENKGPRVLPATETEVASEYDDSSWSGFWLAETFRGARGLERLRRWLASLKLPNASFGAVPRAVFSWPSLRRADPTDGECIEIRPTLLVDAGRNLVVVIAHPPREGNECRATALVEACRAALQSEMSEREVTFVVLEGTGSSSSAGMKAPSVAHGGSSDVVVATWKEMLLALDSGDAHGASGGSGAAAVDAARRARMLAVVEGKDRPEVTNNDLLSSKDRRHDYDGVTFGYRSNVMTVDARAPSVLVCRGCGATAELTRLDLGAAGRMRVRATTKGLEAYRKSGTPNPRLRRLDENSCVVDIIGELTADHELASATARRLGVSTGDVERVLAWPGLDLPGAAGTSRRPSPDAVFLTSDSVIVLEAKKMHGKKMAVETVPQLLLRAIQAEWLGGKLGKRPVVLALGDEFVESAKLGEAVYRQFEEKDYAVADWAPPKKGAPQTLLLESNTELCLALRKRGLAGMRSMFVSVSWHTFREELELAAAELRATAGRVYDGPWRRARGFRTLRDELTRRVAPHAPS